MNFIEGMVGDFYKKVTNGDFWGLLGVDLLKMITIFIAIKVFAKISRTMIGNIIKVRTKSPLRISERREATLIKLLENVLTYVLHFIGFVMILSIFGIEVKSLLAGAGIVGLAVGFGAQSLVKDVITGFFIIFEDQFSVGDMVRIGQFEGVVETIGLRTTKLKSWTGEVHILPNGSIIEVTNFSINNSMAVVDVGIALESDLVKAEKVIEELLLELPERYEQLVTPPQLLGVQNFAASEVILRIVAETLPMQHTFIARMIRKEIKICLDDHGVEIALPRLVMYTRGEQHNQEKTFNTQ